MHLNNKWLIGSFSAVLLSSVALWEGTQYLPYKDIAGIPTVCQGYTGKDIVMGKRYSQEECASFLKKELKIHSEGVLQCINVPIKEHQYNAYVLFAYNVGISGFCNSRALKLLNAGEYTASCWALSKGPTGKPVWSYVGDKFVQGLYNRRQYETAMCLGEKYVSSEG